MIVGGPDQRRLLKYLLVDNSYNPVERPVQNDSDTLPISINLALQHIIEFDGKNEAIVINGWMTLMWNDYSLKWNPAEFGNIQTLRIPSTQLWIPDILLYNSADDKFDGTMKVNAVVQYNGDVLYVPPVFYKSICSFDIAAFPFDTQKCTLKFGTWTYDDAGINLTAESNKGQLDAYVASDEWYLEDFTATNNATKYDCCPTVYPFVLFTVQIRRKYLYYFTNIVLPCFLISCMTILGFLLAPDSGEKLTLQITILLSVVMFSLLLSEIMPASSTAVPIITIYFICVMVMSTLSVVASVLVISIHFRNAKNYTMPLWIRKYICYYLAWILWMKRPEHDLTWRGIRRKWASSKEQLNNINGSLGNHHEKIRSEPKLINKVEMLSNNILNVEEQSLNFLDDREKQRSDSVLDFTAPSETRIQRFRHHQNLSKEFYSCDIEIIRSELRIIISQLSVLTRATRRQEHHDDESQDLKFVAMVVDRLCLILFTFFMIIFTGIFLRNV